MLEFAILIIIFVWLIVFSLGIIIFVFWLFMLIDCLKREFKSDEEKLVWILVLILTGLIGAILYYFLIKNKKK